jgi:hypothetical protein
MAKLENCTPGLSGGDGGVAADTSRLGTQASRREYTLKDFKRVQSVLNAGGVVFPIWIQILADHIQQLMHVKVLWNLDIEALQVVVF